MLVLGVEESAASQTDDRNLSRPGSRAGVVARIGIRGTGKDGVYRRAVTARSVSGKCRMCPGELQERRGNGIACLPQASWFAGLSVEDGQICRVIQMCVISNHMNRHLARSGKGQVLLAGSLADRSP